MTEFGKSDVSPPQEPRSIVPMVRVALVVIALIGIAVYWFTSLDTDEVPEPQPTRVETPPPRVVSPQPIEPEPAELPVLDESDPFIRDLVTAVSSHPDLAAWLIDDGLIRRFVVAVDNVADGRNPSQHLPFMRPGQRFAVSGVETTMRIDPRSYRRYDAHAQIIGSLDTAGTAQLFLRLEPLMDEAYRELGYPNTPFRRTVERAISQLLEVPLVEAPPRVTLGAAFYEYTDERLDDLSPVQKQLLGMGPENARTVQAKLRTVASTLGLQVPR